MSAPSSKGIPPKGLLRWFFRFPVWLYRLGLGGLMGKRFLLLNHLGRKTGKVRQAVLEVVRYDEQTGVYIVVSGYGERSQWAKNLLAHPDVTIQPGKSAIAVKAEPLSQQQSGDEMVRYAHKYPHAARSLSKLMGFAVDGSDNGYRKIGERLLFFALVPAGS